MGGSTGADIITHYLIHEDVPYLFGHTGHRIIGLPKGLHDREDKMIRDAHERHAYDRPSDTALA